MSFLPPNVLAFYLLPVYLFAFHDPYNYWLKIFLQDRIAKYSNHASLGWKYKHFGKDRPFTLKNSIISVVLKQRRLCNSIPIRTSMTSTSCEYTFYCKLLIEKYCEYIFYCKLLTGKRLRSFSLVTVYWRRLNN